MSRIIVELSNGESITIVQADAIFCDLEEFEEKLTNLGQVDKISPTLFGRADIPNIVDEIQSIDRNSLSNLELILTQNENCIEKLLFMPYDEFSKFE